MLLGFMLPSAKLSAQCTAPAPTNLKSTPVSNTSTVLSWNAVTGYTKYRLTVTTDSGLVVLNNVLVTGTSKTVTGLNSNSSYIATVKVQCSTGNVSPNAATLDFSICLLPAPTNFEAIILPGSPPSIVWTWDTVPGALSYVLTVLDVNTGVLQTFTPGSPSQLTDAIVGHTYLGTVSAVCPNGGISPNVSFRTVKVIIIDDVVQFGNPGCGMENDICDFPMPTGIGYLPAASYTLPMAVNFPTGTGRQVLKFRIGEKTTTGAPPTSITSKYVEFKLAFEPGSSIIRFRKVPQASNSLTYRMRADANKNQLVIERLSGSGTTATVTKSGIIEFRDFVPSGGGTNATTFKLEIAKSAAKSSSSFEWLMTEWLCKTCVLAPLPDDGNTDFAEEETVLDLSRQAARPEKMTLMAAPNPAGERVSLRFELPEEQSVSLLLYDAAGKLVREFIRDEWHEAGIHDLEPDLSGLPSGVYRCVLSTASGIQSCQVVKM